MTPDRIERMLRSEPIADEARFVARPLPASVSEARAIVDGPRLGLRRASWLMASLSAVALVVAVVALSTWLDGRGAPSVGTDASPSASAAPSEPSTAGPAGCAAADFGVTSDAWGGAAGSRGTSVIFHVVESVAECRLGGQLAGRIVDASGAVLVESLSSPTSPLIVRGGDQLEVGVEWSNWCGAEPATPLALSVTLPGDATAIPLVPPSGSEILVPPCLGDGQSTNLSITAFQPSNRPSPEG